MNDDIENKLIKLLYKANLKDEVPVSAIITKDNKIIAKSYNKREKNNNVLGHAEINCIKRASRNLKTWKLDDCIMYVTLKPCGMCEKIIKESRIKEVRYLIERSENKKEYDKTIFNKIENSKIEKNIKEIMNNFFKSKR